MARCDGHGPLHGLRGGMSRGRGCALRMVLAVGLVGCGSGSGHPDAAGDAMGPSWWQPKIGEVKNWDIQLSGAIDVSAPRVMYDLDLWALVPAPTMLDYGDGKPVAVPAGPLAGTIAQLHARSPQTIVICHVETGLLEMNRPDASKFPGYKVDATKIPDNPENPAPGTVTGNPEAGSVIGWSIGTASKRLLDTREASRAIWAPFVFKRFDLAKEIGCDGVEPGFNDVSIYVSGFNIMTENTYAWYAEVAKAGHARKLSTGMKNGDLFTDVEAANFDWLMIERCGELGCDAVRPFTDLDKAVLAIDYNKDIDGGNQAAAIVCMNQVTARIQDGLYKDVALTKAVRTQCVP